MRLKQVEDYASTDDATFANAGSICLNSFQHWIFLMHVDVDVVSGNKWHSFICDIICV
jgi:ABC-type metal ion transport system substrate-binding protein